MEYIGKKFLRVDGKEKITGKAKYVDDYEMDGMLYVAVVRSEIAKGRIISINKNIDLCNDIIGIYEAGDFPKEPSYGFPVCDNHILSTGQVNYIGDAICVVCAKTLQAAREAAKKINVIYEPLEPVNDVNSSKKLLKKLVVKKATEDINKINSKEELVYLRAELSTKHQEHAYIEVEGAVATYENNHLTVYAPMQSPFNAKGILCSIMNLKEDQVRVIQTTVGGAFGGKDDVVYEALGFAALCAYKTGKPCKYIPTREESIINSYKRHPIKTKYEIAAKKDGELRSIKVRSVMDGGAYASVSNFVQYRNTTHSVGPYICPVVDVENEVYYTNNVYCGAFRGFGGMQACFFYDTVMDELSYKLNMDPIELRLKNTWKKGSKTPTDELITKEPSTTYLLKRIREVSLWDEKRKEFSEFNKESKYIKKGIGVSLGYHGISLGAEGADYAQSEVIYNEEKNKFLITCGISELGQGSRTVFSQIAQEVLRIDSSYIELNNYDTEFTMDSGPTVASRGSTVGGMAVKMACDNFISEVLKLYGKEKDIEASRLSFKSGNINILGIPIINLMAAVSFLSKKGYELKSYAKYDMPQIDWNEETGLGVPYVAYHFGAHACYLTVDITTGEIKISNYFALHDIGKILNPLGLRGQIIGGISMGMGYALMEDLDIHKGVIHNTNYDNYIIPTSMDMPEIYEEAVEFNEQLGPFGAKGTGEPVISPVAPCIGNAIRFATGKRFYSLPFSLEKIIVGKELSKYEDH